MIKIIITIILFLAFAIFASWISDYNGAVEINWLGYEISTSVIFLLFSSCLLVLIIFFIYNFFSFLLGFPSFFSKKLEKNLLNKNLENLRVSYIALLSGDHKSAEIHSKKINLNATSNKNLLLMKEVLDVTIAKNEGSFLEADKGYKKLLEENSTKFFATQGLLNSSFINGDLNRAIEYAEDAYSLKPNLKDGAHSLLELYKKAEKWEKAEVFLKKYKRKFILFSDKNNSFSANKELSNVYYNLALQAGNNKLFSDESLEKSYSYLISAITYDLENEPAILKLAEICKLLGKENKAKKYIEKLWMVKPSEKLANSYISLAPTSNDTQEFKTKNKASDKLRKINPSGKNFLHEIY